MRAAAFFDWKANVSTAPTIVQIMDAIEAKIVAGGTGLTFNEVISDAMVTPAGFVELPDIPNYRESFGPNGKIKYEPIQVTVLVEKLISRVGLRLLAGLASPQGATSVRAAMEAGGDKTLGGLVDECIVLDYRMLTAAEVGQYGFVGGAFGLRVIALGGS